MSFQSWLGVEGKPRMMVYSVMIMLLVIVAFTGYSVMYTIPEAAVDKVCLQYAADNCDLTIDMYGYCIMQELEGDYMLE